MSAPPVAIRAQGATNPGHVREQNEDCLLVAPEHGLFAVFDGMGGHNAGDVASRLARDVVHEYVLTRRGARPPRELLERAIQKASGAVYEEARSRRELRGMGTTIVCVLIEEGRRALVAHVGDSRAYLLREGHMRLLTRDHTVVSELLHRGAISAEEAVHHPYQSVLSRNLGGKPSTKVDVSEIELAPGDRLLLCSDGLHGYAVHDGVEQVLTGAEDADRAVADLIDLALRGGGGDNVTALVVEAGRAEVPRTTQIVRTAGANAWWARRDRFLKLARARGVADSPICAVLSPDEAVDIVAGNLCEAIFHDLEQTTGVHVWTFTDNLVNGWLEQGGDYGVVRELLDRLREAAEDVVDELAGEGEPIAVPLDMAVQRALVVAEMAVAAGLSERIRRVEKELVRRDLDHTVPPTLTDEKTLPYMGAVRVDPPSPAVSECLEKAASAARERLKAIDAKEQTGEVLAAAHQAALDFASDAELLSPARELFGNRVLNEASVRPLLEALDQARALHLDAATSRPAEPEVKAAAVRRIATAHQSLGHAVASLAVDACQPVTDGLRAAAEKTSSLRAEVGRGEAKLVELERKCTALRGSSPKDGVQES